MTLQSALTTAKNAGHNPGIYSRGIGWRIHLDVATNTWNDVETLRDAEDWLWQQLRSEGTEVPA